MTNTSAPELLAPYRWRNRLLLVFADSPADPRYRLQHDAFAAHRDELAERELLVFGLFDTADGEGDGQVIAPTQTAALRSHYGLDHGVFAVLLIGKDGGEKRRAPEPVAVSEMFALIDSMPMRQQEMRASST